MIVKWRDFVSWNYKKKHILSSSLENKENFEMLGKKLEKKSIDVCSQLYDFIFQVQVIFASTCRLVSLSIDRFDAIFKRWSQMQYLYVVIY